MYGHVGFVVCANCTNDHSRRQLTMVMLNSLISEIIHCMLYTYTKPTQNIDMIWNFFLRDICSFDNIGSGSVRMTRSSTISMPPRMKPKSRMLTVHFPAISPRQPSQKKGMGRHCSTIANVLPMAKPDTTAMRIQIVVLVVFEVTRRR
jgi:hypothetical protein